jgi:hypothetical protein
LPVLDSGATGVLTPLSPLKGKITIRPAKLSDKDFLARLSGEIFSIYGFYPSGQDALMMVNELGKYRNHE